jgi:hypothetical protein
MFNSTFQFIGNLLSSGCSADQSPDDYNGVLLESLSATKGGKRDSARILMKKLVTLDPVFNVQTFSSYPMNAIASLGDTANTIFGSLYSSAYDDISNSFSPRQATYLNILAYFIDSTKVSYVDSLSHYDVKPVTANNRMSSAISEVLASAQSVPSPGYLAPTSHPRML